MLAFLALGLASCAETSSSPDVLSELPGEIRQRSFAPVPVALTCSGPDDALVLTGERVDVPIAWAVDGLDAFRASGYRVAVYAGSVEPLMSVGPGEPIQLALAFGEHRVVLQIVDQTGSVVDAAGARCAARVLVTRSCESDAECDDEFSCNVTSCGTSGASRLCEFAPSAKSRCCTNNFDCPSLEQCEPTLKQCVQCSMNKHCSDGNACTDDVCVNGQCEFTKTNDTCCDCGANQLVSAQCDDGQAITADSCDCASSTCTHTALAMPPTAPSTTPSAADASVTTIPSRAAESLRVFAPVDPESTGVKARSGHAPVRLELLTQSDVTTVLQPYAVVVRGTDAAWQAAEGDVSVTAGGATASCTLDARGLCSLTLAPPTVGRTTVVATAGGGAVRSEPLALDVSVGLSLCRSGVCLRGPSSLVVGQTAQYRIDVDSGVAAFDLVLRGVPFARAAVSDAAPGLVASPASADGRLRVTWVDNAGGARDASLTTMVLSVSPTAATAFDVGMLLQSAWDGAMARRAGGDEGVGTVDVAEPTRRGELLAPWGGDLAAHPEVLTAGRATVPGLSLDDAGRVTETTGADAMAVPAAPSITLTLGRSRLRPVSELDGVSRFETTTLSAVANFGAGVSVDVSDVVSFELPDGLSWQSAGRVLRASRGGHFAIGARGPDGRALATAEVDVGGDDALTVTGLSADSRCADIDAYALGCALRVTATLSGGGSYRLSLADVPPGNLDVDGKLRRSGAFAIEFAGRSAQVILPALESPSLELRVPSRLAVSKTDPAATVAGLPASFVLEAEWVVGGRRVAVPRSLLQLDVGPGIRCTGFECSATGDAGPVELVVTPLTHGQPALRRTIDVVRATGLTVSSELTLSRIEPGRGHQRRAVSVGLGLSDGQVYALPPGSEAVALSARGAVAATGWTLQARRLGTGKIMARGLGFTAETDATVADSTVTVKALTFDLESGATVSAVAGRPFSVGLTATYSDGSTGPVTLMSAQAVTAAGIAGGAVTTSSDAAVMAISDDGVIAHGNGAALLRAEFGGVTAELPLHVNLVADVGDVDIGDTVGLAFKDREASALFELPVRVNVGDVPLGAFDLVLETDPEVVEIVSVVRGDSLKGGIFNSDARGVPGQLRVNGTVALGAELTGEVELFKVELRALKGGDGVTSVGGAILKLVGQDATTPIGTTTPRAIVAGSGAFDPTCAADPVYGDA
ncbi:MAG: hypothetical protein IV100_02030, partial [Myxococcales bacterium]|nr:hypothetical protein [Myxococcales bacterium]